VVGLPKLAVGDRWLFFLRKEAGKPIVLDYYGNDSRPVAKAREQIETLRRLKTMGDFGLLRGDVLRGPSYSNRKPVPGVRVVATRSSDNAKFFATTDADGDYEFQPVPVGKYELAVDSIGPMYVGDAVLKVTGGLCWNVTLWKSPDPRTKDSRLDHLRRFAVKDWRRETDSILGIGSFLRDCPRMCMLASVYRGIVKDSAWLILRRTDLLYR
jgi:hypothetical protein